MPRKRKANQKNGLQTAGVFLFFLTIRIFVLFFYSTSVPRYLDIYSVFLAFILFRQKVKGTSLFAWAWMGGLTEDLISGNILGINALSKLISSVIFQLSSKKVEIGNIYIQVPMAMLLFFIDTLAKYIIASVIYGSPIDQHLMLTISVVRICTGTILFLISCAILR